MGFIKVPKFYEQNQEKKAAWLREPWAGYGGAAGLAMPSLVRGCWCVLLAQHRGRTSLHLDLTFGLLRGSLPLLPPNTLVFR